MRDYTVSLNTILNIVDQEDQEVLLLFSNYSYRQCYGSDEVNLVNFLKRNWKPKQEKIHVNSRKRFNLHTNLYRFS